ncbi:MAG: hypothetical protein ACRDPR_14655 [Nocardioidaceae bacterium]
MLRQQADIVVADTLEGEKQTAASGRERHRKRREPLLTPSTQEFLSRTRVPTLYKPFDAERVRQVVQRALGAAGAVERGK